MHPIGVIGGIPGNKEFKAVQTGGPSGGCIYICRACQLSCQRPQADTALCNACLTMDHIYLDFYDDLQCWMYDAGQ